MNKNHSLCRFRQLLCPAVAALIPALLYLINVPSFAQGEAPRFVAPMTRAQPEAVPPLLLRRSILAQAFQSELKARQEGRPEPEEKKPAEGEQDTKPSEETTDQACMGCHGPDMLKIQQDRRAEQIILGDKVTPRPSLPFRMGGLSVVIDEKKFSESPHGGTSCLDCHKDASGQHQRLKSVDCRECHEESAEAVRVSAHGEQPGKEATNCLGCHDVHHGKAREGLVADFNGRVCADCHKAHGMDLERQHRKMYESRMHLVMDCMLCHSGEKPGVHNIPAEKGKAARCESCHTAHTVLSKQKEKPISFFGSVRNIGFINDNALKKYGYVIGAHRIPALDALVFLAVLAPLGLCLFHGTVRAVSRRKGPIHISEEMIYLHPLIERLWHWAQGFCTIVLIVTGAMMHWPEQFPGWFQWAVATHNQFGIAAVVVFLVWLVYNLFTGRISHYIPRKRDIEGIFKQIRFYAWGIFRHEPHPYAPTEDEKFNPLQKIAYLQFQLFILPIVLASGLLYMYPDTLRGVIERIGGMALLGSIHFFLGGLFAAFLVAHVYLATTGETLGEYMKSMITGYVPRPRSADAKDHRAS